MLWDVADPDPLEKQGQAIYFGNEISFLVGSRADTVLKKRKIESSLYNEVWPLRMA